MICDFLMKDSAEEQIGETIGYLVGMIAFQALLDYLSAGTWTGAMGVLSSIAKFLNWPMEFLGEAMAALKKLGGFILDGIKGLGSMVAEAGAGPLREVVGAFGEIGTKLGEFAEELLAKFRGEAGAADNAAAHAVESDAAKVAEKDAAGAAEKDAASAEKDAGAAKDGEGKPKEGEGGSAAEKEAQKAEELVEAIEISKGIAAGEEAGHMPAPLIALSLDALEARYTWIKTYEARPEGGAFGIYMIASEHFIKRVQEHELGDLAPVDLKEYVGADTKIIGEQRTISLEGRNWREGIPSDLKTPGKDLIYTIRDSETGEILKIGKTQGETLEARLQKYVTANNTSGRKVVMDVAEVKLPEGATIESAEDVARQNLLPDARKEAGLGKDGVAEKDVLPWDNTNSRLGREGPGIPGEDTYRLAKKGLKWDGEKLVPIDPANAGPRALVPRGAPQDFQEIVLAFDRKVADIAQYCGVSETTVYNWLRAAGL